MALQQAWAVDGSRVPASMLRFVAWTATAGQSGVVLGSHMKVSALATPGGAVNVSTGNAVLSSRYATSSPLESYLVANSATTQVPIAPTGSSGGRVDYVIVRITDWHFDSSPVPEDPENATYCEFAVVQSIDNLDYPFVPLARLVIPSNTATITNSMITDIRETTTFVSYRAMKGIPATAQDTGMSLTVTSEGGEYFPNGLDNHLGPVDIDIPWWATRALIRTDWLSVKYTGSGGAPYGRYWVEWGPKTGTSDRQYHTQKFFFDSPGGNNMRTNWILMQDVFVPAAMRGTTQKFVPKATLDGGTGVSMDAKSGMGWDIEFRAAADTSVD